MDVVTLPARMLAQPYFNNFCECDEFLRMINLEKLTDFMPA